MEHSKEYYYELARRWAEGTITPEEAKEYIEWFNQDDHEPLYIPPGFAGSREELNHRMLAIIQKSIEEQAPVISINKYRRARWVAAASIALLIAVGSYFFFFNHKSQITDHTSAIASNDVKAPAANRATITMSNGKIIYLDSVANGQLAIQNNVSLIKTDDGKISYRLTATSQQLTAQYNTLTNPRGSKVIDMTLSDGSHVWLNAGSSVTYPVAFIDNERKVTITGEAYFEVKHNEKMPFTVAANGVEVHDLGTSFNINAYDDEDAIRVTLLEGSVKVKSGTLEVKIKPGEQADIDPIHHSPFTIHQPDVEQVMAWRNGWFEFDEMDLGTIMRQVSRWYDVNVQFKSPPTGAKYFGRISNKLSLSNVLKMLESNGPGFQLEGKNLIVSP